MKYKYKGNIKFKSNLGFTLVEMLVGLSLAAILGLIVAQLTIQQSENTVKISDYFEFNELTIRLGENLRNNSACENTFRDLALPSAGSPITTISVIRGANNAAIFDMLDAVDPFDPILSPTARVTKMELRAFDRSLTDYQFTTDGTLYRLQLEVFFERRVGPDNVTNFHRTIPIIAKVDANDTSKIFTCYNDENAWNRQLCEGLLSGIYTEKDGINERMCEHMNVKGSVSTDGHFCFNTITSAAPYTYKAGNIHEKDCINSWYGGWAQNFGGEDCYIEKAKSICKADFVIAGVTVTACGKRCVRSDLTCCKVRLQKSL